MHAATTNPENTERSTLLARVACVEPNNFDDLALDIFRYQCTHNPIYREYCMLLGKDTRNVLVIRDIPFLPVSMFRTSDIRTNVWTAEVVFHSSTTTGQIPSKHAIRDLRAYHENCMRGFAQSMGMHVGDSVWLALLPSYRPESSLISMVSAFIRQGRDGSRFIDIENAETILGAWDKQNVSVCLIGVSFALHDLASHATLNLANTNIIETGGMKGRQYEPTRTELHDKLRRGFGTTSIWSEYGMTELQSQAWSQANGRFRPAPTLKVAMRDLSDPLTLLTNNERGAINCIDLANLDTCAFIATDDLGICHADGTFEVLGRYDASEIRGCNLMADQIQ